MLRKLRKANQKRQQTWDPKALITPSFRGLEMAGEAGEACNLIKKLERERLGLQGSRASVGHLAEELADIIICVDLVAADFGIDLEEAIAAKFNATSEKQGFPDRL